MVSCDTGKKFHVQTIARGDCSEVLVSSLLLPRNKSTQLGSFLAYNGTIPFNNCTSLMKKVWKEQNPWKWRVSACTARSLCFNDVRQGLRGDSALTTKCIFLQYHRTFFNNWKPMFIVEKMEDPFLKNGVLCTGRVFLWHPTEYDC